MTTIAKNLGSQAGAFATLSNQAGNRTAKKVTSYDQFIKNLEFWHFSIISVAIIFSSCLGGIATMQIFENNAPFWEFLLAIGFTMANLVACIAQAPTKWVVNLFAASMLINALLLIINLV